MPADNSRNMYDFEPYIPTKSNIAEITAKAIVLGAIISVVFGAANAYIGLKCGMTVSAGIILWSDLLPTTKMTENEKLA